MCISSYVSKIKRKDNKYNLFLHNIYKYINIVLARKDRNNDNSKKKEH